jgi:hypothetical protein
LLGLSKRRVYELYADYLRACAQRTQAHWVPRVSGGVRRAPLPPPAQELLRVFLTAVPPLSYSFAASELDRRLGIKTDRATVRRFALKQHLVPASIVRPPAAIKRWQRSRIGELWQLDATPHAWFPGSKTLYPMLNLLDDCSRLITGSRLYHHERLLSYFDLLPAAFAEHGLPLCLYVDYHSLFFTHLPDSLTQLGWALKFYDISLDYAPTPQAKGKIERCHLFWQKRLPAVFAADGVHDLPAANALIQQLRQHHNAHERQRELRMPPLAAWRRARRDGRCALRPKPKCPWWPFVWAQRTQIKVAPDGSVPVGSHRCHISAPAGSTVTLCHHPDGRYSVLKAPPTHGSKPIRLLEYGWDQSVRF